MAVPLNVTGWAKVAVPQTFNDPATFRFCPIPTPPLTVKAPLVDVELPVALVMLTALLVVAPRPVTL